MDLQAAKLDVMQKVMAVTKTSLLNKISKLLDKEMVVGFTVEGKPLTKAAYDKRLQKAEQQVRSGQHLSQQDLEKESENW